MPSIDSSYYQHPLDKQTLDAMRSMPVFPAFMKAFMKVYSERRVFIENCSSNIEITPKQLPHIYEMLPPICEKLGIDVPRLYLTNRRDINAMATNENDPFIVLNTGTLECCSDDIVYGILAHECGHIACHHVLYHTIGNLVLTGMAELLPGIGKLLTAGLRYAFYKWMRASEYSADRAAALVLGGSKPTVDMLVCFAGGYQSLELDIDKEAFIEQALAYEQAITESITDQFFEGWFFGNATHPFTAYRALEVSRWCLTPDFEQFQDVLSGKAPALPVPGTAVAGIAPLNTAAPIPSAQNSFCTNCGNPIAAGNAFCANCGAKLV